MKVLIKAAAIVMAVILISCGKGTNSRALTVSDVKLEEMDKAKTESSNNLSTADTTTTAQAHSGNIALQSGDPVPANWDKKIIKTANVTLELDDYKTFNSTIHTSIKRYSAYVANEEQNQSDNKIENVITIKVPVTQFEDLINALPAEGVKVLERRISSEDVTGEIVDTKARIEARKQVRDQYLALLKKAKTMKEILEVQKELNGIQEDIEAGTRRAELLGHEAAYSTVNLTYFQYILPTSGIDKSSPTFATKIKEAFYDGASIVSQFLLLIVTFWPIVLVVFLIWFLFKRYPSKLVKLEKKGNL